MSLPSSVVKGKTVVLRTSLEVADSRNRQKILHEIVPAKVDDRNGFVNCEHNLVLNSLVNLNQVYSFAFISAQDDFKLKLNGSVIITKFFQFTGQATVEIERHLKDTRVKCIYS
jgi:hypothetical protein